MEQNNNIFIWKIINNHLKKLNRQILFRRNYCQRLNQSAKLRDKFVDFIFIPNHSPFITFFKVTLMKFSRNISMMEERANKNQHLNSPV